MSSRGRNNNVQKFCDCGRSRWPKCPHAWYFRFKPRGRGQRWQFSLDAELGRHIGSKTEAENEAAKIRVTILAGTFRRATEAAAIQAPTGITLDQFAPVYIERASKASGKRTWANDAGMFVRLRDYRASDGRRLGDWLLPDITEDTIEAFYVSLSDFAASTRNQYVQLLKASFRWAAKKGYTQRSPISEDSALKRSKVAQRTRRLSADEETALLKAAGELDRRVGLRLSGLIVAALETGCRRGELLGLQWSDVNLSRRELLIRAENTKDAEVRRLPISTRLHAVLEMARADPTGREYPPTAFVFGAFGQRVKNVKKAWETCALRAYGHEPKWEGSTLSCASRAQLQAIDLHFHDLRHEAGSRWLEAGWPIHYVKEMLGHANISQTDTYLNAGRMGLQDAMKRFDAARVERPAADSRGKSVVNNERIGHPTVNHGEHQTNAKDLLH